VPGALLRYAWVVDLDVEKFFDSVPWDLVIKAVEAHIAEPWVLLYIKRWPCRPACNSPTGR